jgi:hypothetical protein
MNMIRYHGVLGPASSLRRKVVKKNKKPPKEKKVPPNRRYIEWAKLLKRVFEIEITQCSCGGEVKIVAAILSSDAIVPILEHLKLSTEAPEIAPARAPPQQDFFDWQ